MKRYQNEQYENGETSIFVCFKQWTFECMRYIAEYTRAIDNNNIFILLDDIAEHRLMG